MSADPGPSELGAHGAGPVTVWVRHADRGVYGSDWNYTRTSLEARLYLPLGGSGEVGIDGRILPLERGRIYLVPKGHVVRCRSGGELDLAWVHLDLLTYGCIDYLSLCGWLPSAPLADPDAAAETIVRIGLSTSTGDARERLWAAAATLGLVALLVRSPDPPTTAAAIRRHRRLEPVLAHIDAHLAEPLHVADLARLVCVTPAHFSEVFRASIGQPPAAYIRARRVEAAKRLLIETDLSLSAIAARTGFCDAFHLSRVFRTHTGCSPRRWSAQPIRP